MWRMATPNMMSTNNLGTPKLETEIHTTDKIWGEGGTEQSKAKLKETQPLLEQCKRVLMGLTVN